MTKPERGPERHCPAALVEACGESQRTAEPEPGYCSLKGWNRKRRGGKQPGLAAGELGGCDGAVVDPFGIGRAGNSTGRTMRLYTH